MRRQFHADGVAVVLQDVHRQVIDEEQAIVAERVAAERDRLVASWSMKLKPVLSA
jgi:hypothetical protein